MLHFLASIGKKPWARGIMPLTALVVPSVYITFHMYGHKLARNILAASSESGRRDEISKNLQTLIKQVYTEIKSDFNVPMTSNILTKPNVPVIKWFASSTPDPVTLGMAETKSGVAIGLPSYYNYEKREDVPSTILEVTRFKLFKSWTKSNNNKEEKDRDPTMEVAKTGEDNILRTRINESSHDAQQYIDSLVLSENAKKFSIARELFLSDTYRPLLIWTVMVSSALLSVFVSRAAVQKIRLLDAHLSYRLPCYVLAGMAGYVNYIFLSDIIDTNYSNKADLRAISVNESYRDGAVEYFTKIIQRNKALRNLMEESASTYDEEGNIMEPPLRRRFIKFTERLEVAKKNANG